MSKMIFDFVYNIIKNHFRLYISRSLLNTEIYLATNDQPEHDKDNKTKNHQVTLHFLVKKKTKIILNK